MKIEAVTGYSPLAPVSCSRRWGRDAMYGPGHELGRVQPEEIVRTTLDALIYREYEDPHYTVPVTGKIIGSDANEPPWDRRVPGAVLYARPGERLRVHVLNGDPEECHSFHLHGLQYGIDSDGAWPFGIGSRAGRRSDEIRPGESWTYTFDATAETIGAWAFHDHVRNVQANVNRGLFGGLIVRDPAAPRADHEVPLFVHQLQAPRSAGAFESETLGHGVSFLHQFDTAGRVDYHCKIHGVTMSGVIQVDPGAPAGDQTVDISDNLFTPATRSVRPGNTVTWTNKGNFDHIVLATGGGQSTFCLNGRAYVGNTPTIDARPGERLRWYVLNLDLGSVWHNFHPHSTRWRLPTPSGGAGDVHALSPVDSFVVDTEVPDALRLPCALADLQCDPPEDACRIRVRGDFLFHCHLEEHMMSGLAGLVRAREWIWLTPQVADDLDLVLPLDDRHNEADWVDLARCGQTCPTGEHGHRPDDSNHHDDHSNEQAHDEGNADADHPDATRRRRATPVSATPGMSMPGMSMPGMSMPGMSMPGMSMPGMSMPGVEPVDVCEAAEKGHWELLPCDSQVLAVHAVLLHTGKVLFFAGSGNNVDRFNARDVRSVVWDYEGGSFHTPTSPFDVFCAGQTVLPDGKVLVAGGTEQYDPFIGAKAAYFFDPVLEEWIRLGDMAAGRWYPTLLSLADGDAVAVSGIQAPSERFDPATGWTTLPPATNLPLYPHLFLLQDGRVFFTGGQLGGAVIDARVMNLDAGTEDVVPGLRDQGNRDEAFSVMLPPAQDQRFMVLGGGGAAQATASTDIVDLSAGPAGVAYQPGPDLLRARGLHNAVILPDRTVFVSGGGLHGETRADAVHLAEIYDPATNTIRAAATASVSRLYHSIALLLPDGRVITAGSNPDRGDDELRLELFHPPYLFRGPRPSIDSCPTQWTYGSTVTIHSSQAPQIKWAQLIRPMAVTHSDDTSQRLIDLPILERDLCHLHVNLPDNPNLAPPGWYMLFLCDQQGIPSIATWVHLAQPAPQPELLHGHVRHTHTDHQREHQPGFPIPGFPLPGPSRTG